jgi:hypothetical protein
VLPPTARHWFFQQWVGRLREVVPSWWLPAGIAQGLGCQGGGLECWQGMGLVLKQVEDAGGEVWQLLVQNWECVGP